MDKQQRHRPSCRRRCGQTGGQCCRDRRDRRDFFCEQAAQAEGKEAAIGYACGIDAPGIDMQLCAKRLYQRRDKSDVIHSISFRRRMASSITPLLLIPIGIDHQKMMLVCHAIEMRPASHPARRRSAAMKGQHQRIRAPRCVGNREMHNIRARQTANVQCRSVLHMQNPPGGLSSSLCPPAFTQDCTEEKHRGQFVTCTQCSCFRTRTLRYASKRTMYGKKRFQQRDYPNDWSMGHRAERSPFIISAMQTKCSPGWTQF